MIYLEYSQNHKSKRAHSMYWFYARNPYQKLKWVLKNPPKIYEKHFITMEMEGLELFLWFSTKIPYEENGQKMLLRGTYPGSLLDSHWPWRKDFKSRFDGENSCSKSRISDGQYTKSITEWRERKTPPDFNFQKRRFLFSCSCYRVSKKDLLGWEQVSIFDASHHSSFLCENHCCVG